MAARLRLQPGTGHDSDNEDTYEDAVERITLSQNELDLNTTIQEASVALKLFFTNHFAEARDRMKPFADCSMYHSLGYGTILYIQAVMTFDMGDIEQAIAAMKRSVIVSSKMRRRSTLLGSIAKVTSGVNYNEFTEEEVHAEICYTESLLIRALLTFIQDENLISFVKGGFKIRECYKIYKECNKILENRNWEKDVHKVHFESGVRMGVGAFNLMISLLPSKIMKLLEFAGFSGSKKLGLSELLKGSELHTSLRGPLCAIVLIAYHTVVTYVLGLGDGDVDLASSLLSPCLQTFPKGALFLFFAGRIEEIRANIDEAILRFEESIESQSEWRQFHHLCYWELMWCHCFRSDWLMAMKYAERLCKESRWSKATYTYQKASFLLMCDDQTEKTKTHLKYLFSEVPKLKQRIAGKSIPFEKFAVAKAKRYLEQNEYLTLPAVELIYVWNGFNVIGKKQFLLEPILMIVEKTVHTILEDKASHKFYFDDYSLALLLKGVCLRHRGQFLQAEQCFLEVLGNEKDIVYDKYLIPYATVELAIVYLQQDRLSDVKSCIHRAKKNYKGYYLESRLHFRIHALRLQLNAAANNDESVSSDPPTPTNSGSLDVLSTSKDHRISLAQSSNGSLSQQGGEGNIVPSGSDRCSGRELAPAENKLSMT
ncbi:tetratricopeptide repeat protein 39B-like [Pomacea canaliculata]|uniref:tetratricopeptide repeat protein 39B-like n=1 Tax=Pomacea canaliculata TaxID=400727 RepID=UPI000D73E957|nr:tetratricopeptide repeat protein 39B-like [Pomacea canaliculata]